MLARGNVAIFLQERSACSIPPTGRRIVVMDGEDNCTEKKNGKNGVDFGDNLQLRASFPTFRA